MLPDPTTSELCLLVTLAIVCLHPVLWWACWLTYRRFRP